MKTRSNAHPGRSGFTLVELVVGMAVMMVALLALLSTSLVTHSLEESNRSRSLALEAVRAAAERLQARSAMAIEDEDGWARTLTDAYRPGGNPGVTFDMPGLQAWDGLPTVGTVTVVTSELVSDEDLGVELGLPRDLDGDGLTATGDVSTTAVLLPVIVRVRWTGTAGDRELAQGFFVAEF